MQEEDLKKMKKALKKELRLIDIFHSEMLTTLRALGLDTELQNVNSFTRSKTLKLNFAPRKAHKSQQFWDLRETKLTKITFLDNKC